MCVPRKGISQAIKFGNMLFVSGQVGEDENGKAPAGIEAQVELAITNAKHIIEAAGASLDDVLMCRCFLQTPQRLSQIIASRSHTFPAVIKQFYAFHR